MRAFVHRFPSRALKGCLSDAQRCSFQFMCLSSSRRGSSSTKGIIDGNHTKRPFKVLGVQQIAIGSSDKKALTYFWDDLMGLKKVGSYRSEQENVDEDIYTTGTNESGNEIEIDLMQPIDPEKAPKVHIPALNHIGLWVDNLHAAVEYLTTKGIKFTPGGIRKGAAGHEVAFIHPKSAVGVLIELVQSPALTAVPLPLPIEQLIIPDAVKIPTATITK